MKTPKTRSFSLCWLCLAGVALLLPSCGWDGNLEVLGYSTKPNYDCDIRTVRVPIFENRTFEQGLEFDLTRAVIREIEQKTPFKVVDANAPADTELTGEILQLEKRTLLFSPLFKNRTIEFVLEVELHWKDLRTGEYLTARARNNDDNYFPGEYLLGRQSIMGDPTILTPTQPGSPGIDVGALPPPKEGKKPPPVELRATSNYSEELGESRTTGKQDVVNKMASLIRGLMESPW